MFIGLGVVGVTILIVALRKYFSSASNNLAEEKNPTALNPNKKIAFELIEKEVSIQKLLSILSLTGFRK